MILRDDFYPTVGLAIRSARKSSGLTQEKLALAVGLTRTSINNIENGRQKLLLDGFCRIAIALGVDPADLLSRCKASYAEDTESDINAFILKAKIPGENDLNDDELRAMSHGVLISKKGGGDGKN